MLIGDRIKQLRLDAKMTQPELAERLKVTRSAVATYENNTRQPSFQILVRIAHIFQVSTDYLLLGNEHDTIDISGLSLEQKRILANLVSNFKQSNQIILSNARQQREFAIQKELEKQFEENTDSNKE